MCSEFKFLLVLFFFDLRITLSRCGFLYDPNPDINLTMEQLVRKNGYPFEVHKNVQTPDGYLLTIQRIPYGARCSMVAGDRPVVFMLHGILSSAETWTIGGPEYGLGYILADKGYDVWMGNTRGNQFSRKHIHYNADNSTDYWKFSWHEIGVYDTSAMIDYVLEKTGKTQLIYIGHSQGTTSFFVMASEKPQYNRKIKLMIALAPVAFMGNMRQPHLKFLAFHYEFINKFVKKFNYYELLPFRMRLWRNAKVLCSERNFFENFCAVLFFIFTGFDWEQLNRPLVSLMLSRMPDGISAMQLLHFAQSVVTGKFRRYDFGIGGNIDIYGTKNPPKYTIEKISTPVALVYGMNDLLVSEKDVDLLAQNLPNVIEKMVVPYKRFTHLDFILAKNINEAVWKRLITLMNRYNV